MNFEGHARGRNDHILYDVNIVEDPLVTIRVRPSVPQKHAVQAVHEVVTMHTNTTKMRLRGKEQVREKSSDKNG